MTKEIKNEKVTQENTGAFGNIKLKGISIKNYNPSRRGRSVQGARKPVNTKFIGYEYSISTPAMLKEYCKSMDLPFEEILQLNTIPEAVDASSLPKEGLIGSETINLYGLPYKVLSSKYQHDVASVASALNINTELSVPGIGNVSCIKNLIMYLTHSIDMPIYNYDNRKKFKLPDGLTFRTDKLLLPMTMLLMALYSENKSRFTKGIKALSEVHIASPDFPKFTYYNFSETGNPINIVNTCKVWVNTVRFTLLVNKLASLLQNDNTAEYPKLDIDNIAHMFLRDFLDEKIAKFKKSSRNNVFVPNVNVDIIRSIYKKRKMSDEVCEEIESKFKELEELSKQSKQIKG